MSDERERTSGQTQQYDMDMLDGNDIQIVDKRKPFKRGCALFVIVLLIGVGVLITLANVLDVFEDEEVYYEEYSPDLRMDLTMLFGSDEAWRDGLDRLDTLVMDLEARRDTFGKSSDSLREALRIKENIYKLADRLEIYANLKYDTDFDLEDAGDMVEEIAFIRTEIGERLSFVDQEATKISIENLSEWAELEEFGPYIADMEYWIEYYDYGFDEEREALIAGGQRLAEIPEEIYESFQYLTDIPEADLYYDDFVSDNSKTREKAFEDLYKKSFIGAEVLASALEGEVITNNYLADIYGYEDAFDMDLEVDGIEPEDYEKFVEETKKGLVLMHRWTGLRRELKGLSKEEKLHMYDQFLPYIYEDFELKGSIEFERGVDLIQSSMNPLGTEYLNTFNDLILAEVIDITPRETKVDGAYTWGTFDEKPYVLLNYYGDFEDVLTIGHEMGHAVHHELSRKNQSFGEYNSSILISEMAATTNEALTLESLLELPDHLRTESREAVLVKYADSIEQTIFMQLMASEFQRKIHEDAKLGINLDANHLNLRWSELIQEFYGPDYELSETDGLGWTDMQHLFWGFYVQKYAVGYTAGISNADKLLNDPDFKNVYLSILKQGGSELAGDQLEAFGYGKAGELAVESMLIRFDEILDEIELTIEAKK